MHSINIIVKYNYSITLVRLVLPIPLDPAILPHGSHQGGSANLVWGICGHGRVIPAAQAEL